MYPLAPLSDPSLSIFRGKFQRMNDTSRYYNPRYPTYIISGAPGIAPNEVYNHDCIGFVPRPINGTMAPTPLPSKSPAKTKITINLDIEESDSDDVEIDFNVNIHHTHQRNAPRHIEGIASASICY